MTDQFECDMLDILGYLKTSGKITDEDILEAQRAMSSGVKELVTLLHTMLCSSPTCQWLAEEDLENTWGYSHHREWIEKVNNHLGEIPLAKVKKLIVQAGTFANIVEMLRDNNDYEHRLWNLIYQYRYVAKIVG